MGKEGALISCFIGNTARLKTDNINILGEWEDKKSGRERFAHPSPPPFYSQVLSATSFLLITLLPSTLRGAPQPAPGLVPSSILTFMGVPEYILRYQNSSRWRLSLGAGPRAPSSAVITNSQTCIRLISHESLKPKERRQM